MTPTHTCSLVLVLDRDGLFLGPGSTRRPTNARSLEHFFFCCCCRPAARLTHTTLHLAVDVPRARRGSAVSVNVVATVGTALAIGELRSSSSRAGCRVGRHDARRAAWSTEGEGGRL